MSDPVSSSSIAAGDPIHHSGHGFAPEEERSPSCPSCNRRLVILAMHWGRDREGRSVRRQLWGCPRGHATAYRVNGIFGPVELLPEVAG